MLLTSLQAMKLTSLRQLIELSAKREILLTSGGAYISIKAGKIEIHASLRIFCTLEGRVKCL